jgi:hypothetical protein
MYHESMWHEATRDYAAEEADRRGVMARQASLSIWPYASLAVSEADLDHRLAMVEAAISAAADLHGIEAGEVRDVLVGDWRLLAEAKSQSEDDSEGRPDQDQDDADADDDDSDDDSDDSDDDDDDDSDDDSDDDDDDDPDGDGDDDSSASGDTDDDKGMPWAKSSARQGARFPVVAEKKRDDETWDQYRQRDAAEEYADTPVFDEASTNGPRHKGGGVWHVSCPTCGDAVEGYGPGGATSALSAHRSKEHVGTSASKTAINDAELSQYDNEMAHNREAERYEPHHSGNSCEFCGMQGNANGAGGEALHATPWGSMHPACHEEWKNGVGHEYDHDIDAYHADVEDDRRADRDDDYYSDPDPAMSSGDPYGRHEDAMERYRTYSKTAAGDPFEPRCKTCNGTGSHPWDAIRNCPKCKGTGLQSKPRKQVADALGVPEREVQAAKTADHQWIPWQYAQPVSGDEVRDTPNGIVGEPDVATADEGMTDQRLSNPQTYQQQMSRESARVWSLLKGAEFGNATPSSDLNPGPSKPYEGSDVVPSSEALSSKPRQMPSGGMDFDPASMGQEQPDAPAPDAKQGMRRMVAHILRDNPQMSLAEAREIAAQASVLAGMDARNFGSGYSGADGPLTSQYLNKAPEELAKLIPINKFKIPIGKGKAIEETGEALDGATKEL